MPEPIYWCHGATGIGLTRYRESKWLNDKKEDFPAEKEKICYGKYLFTILEVDKRRIIKIKVRIDREEKE